VIIANGHIVDGTVSPFTLLLDPRVPSKIYQGIAAENHKRGQLTAGAKLALAARRRMVPQDRAARIASEAGDFDVNDADSVRRAIVSVLATQIGPETQTAGIHGRGLFQAGAALRCVVCGGGCYSCAAIFSLWSIRVKSPILAVLLAVAVALPAFAALKQGDAAPDFSAQASLAGKTFAYSLADARRNGPVVVYFYPSAFTGGCNVQAHEFAVNMDKFQAAGASVIGVSLDNITRLNDFSADPKYCAGKVAVASDADGKIAGAFHLKIDPEEQGAKDSRGIEIGHGFAQRTTFIVSPGGKITATIGGLGPAKNVESALAQVQRLAATNSGKK
jgi:peroxiredoxin Q/BCP